MRLIDADALLEAGRKIKMTDIIPEYKQLSFDAKNALATLGTTNKKLIVEAPTIDAVEVVRCKDCKYAWFHPAGYIGCKRRGHVAPMLWFDYESFCSYGERRKNASD